MGKLTFDQLPEAVAEIRAALIRIEAELIRQRTQKQDNQDRMLTVKEAADFLSLSKHSIYAKVHNREMPFIKRGGKLYFSKTDLIEWLKQGRKKTVKELQSEVMEKAFKHKRKK